MSRIFILFVLFILSTTTFSETFYGVANEWAPFTGSKLENQGLAVEITKAAYKTQGVDIDIAYFPWARALKGVKEADYDFIVAIWKTEERAEFLNMSQPYLENKIAFIKNKGDSFEYEGLESLNDKDVAVSRGYGYGDAFLSATNFRRPESNNLLKCIKKLVAGRVDLTLEDEVVSRYELKNNAPELLEKIEFTNNALSSNSVYLASSLGHSKNKMIIERFNKGLQVIKENGTYAEIMKRYGF